MNRAGLIFRSCLFNIVFYANLTVFLLLGSWLFICPRSWAMAGLRLWAKASLFWLKLICGLEMEVRGTEHIRPGPCLYAGKHQSAWDTFALIPLFADPAMVLKRELTFIPVFGWFALKFRMLPVDRGAGPKALRHLITHATRARDDAREIVIFPEGTRRAPGAPPDYKPGAAALYAALDIPCVPFALNSGQFWPRRSFVRHPGKITVEFLAPIAAGLSRKDFAKQLQAVIETASTRLMTGTDL